MITYILKIKIYFLLLALFISCAKQDLIDEPEKGSLYGSVLLYDKHDIINNSFQDISIEISDSNGFSTNIYPNSSGIFQAELLPLGDLYLTIDKPGYVGLKTIRFQNTVEVDSLPQILLFEELNFSTVNFWINYTDNYLKWNSQIDFTPTETYLVAPFIFLNNSPDVSANNYLKYFTGGATNINYINSMVSQGLYSPIENFLNNGFTSRDLVYAVSYAVTQKFIREFYWQTQDFEIIEIKLNNNSNIAFFILP